MTENHEGCVLAIVGSRDVPRYQAESLIRQAILEHKPSMIVSGGAAGIDSFAVEIAQEMGIGTVEFLALINEWNNTGSGGKPKEHMGLTGSMRIQIDGGYKQRNEKIAEAAACVIRIASQTTKTYGSGWTADYAERIGKRVYRHTV